MNIFKTISGNKLVKITKKIIQGIIIFLALIFIIAIYLQKFSNNEMSFFNYRMFTVVTGSMEPRYNINDVLFAKEIDPSKIKVGDDISYKGVTGDVKGKIVTHEVVSIIKEDNGEYLFNAKGLTNMIQDPVIHESQLYGVIVGKSVILSAIYNIISTTIGFFLCIVIPMLGIVGYELISTLLDKEAKKRNLN